MRANKIEIQVLKKFNLICKASFLLLQAPVFSEPEPFIFQPTFNKFLRGFMGLPDQTPKDLLDFPASVTLIVENKNSSEFFTFHQMDIRFPESGFARILIPNDERNISAWDGICSLCGMNEIMELNPESKGPYVVILTGEDSRILPLGHSF